MADLLLLINQITAAVCDIHCYKLEKIPYILRKYKLDSDINLVRQLADLRYEQTKHLPKDQRNMAIAKLARGQLKYLRGYLK